MFHRVGRSALPAAAPVPLTAALAAGAAALLGLLTVYAAPQLVLAIGAVLFLVSIGWKVGMVVAYGASAFLSGWFLAAAHVGQLNTSPHASSVTTWSILLVIAGAISLRDPVHLPRRLVFATLIYVGGLVPSVLMASFSADTGDPGLLGVKAVLVGLTPLAVMALLRQRRFVSTGLVIVLGFLVAEELYSAAQLVSVRGWGPSLPWFTVGSAEALWGDALYGTFATVAKNAFGGALALLAPVAAVFALHGRTRRLQCACAAIFISTLAFVLLSRSRTALVAVIVAAVVVALPSGRRRLLGFGLITLVVFGSLPITSSTFDAIRLQGMVDNDVRARQLIWGSLLEQRSASWLVGEGYDSVVDITREHGLSYLNGTHTGRPGAPAENLYLRRIVEGGILGLGSLLALFYLLLRESFAPSRTPEGRVWRLALRGIVVTCMLECLTADVLTYDQWAAVFWLAVGICGAALAVEARRRSAPARESPATGAQLGGAWAGKGLREPPVVSGPAMGLAARGGDAWADRL